VGDSALEEGKIIDKEALSFSSEREEISHNNQQHNKKRRRKRGKKFEHPRNAKWKSARELLKKRGKRRRPLYATKKAVSLAQRRREKKGA